MSDPISTALQQYLTQYPIPQRIGVAVSGGPDSMALLHCLHQWCQNAQKELVAFHVNHQLRPAASDEAVQVATWCAAWDIPYEILVWHHTPYDKTTVQKEAREARYQLLQEACQKSYVTHLFLAHHHNDQIETLLLRLFKGSGLMGLVGMQPIAQRSSLTLMRPLLTCTKEAITHYVAQYNIPFLKDPSNQNNAFLRVKIRSFVQQAQEGGLDPALLQTSFQKLALFQESFQDDFIDFIKQYGVLSTLGYLTIDHHHFCHLSFAKQCFFLELCLKIVGGHYYAPRWDSLKQMAKNLTHPSFKAQTLGGCYVRIKKSTIEIMRECACVTEEISLSSSKIWWDRRFFIDNLPQDTIYSKCHIKKLGRDGRLFLKKAGVPTVSTHPAPAIEALPALWQKDQLLAVPSILYGQKEIRVTFSPETLARLPHTLEQQGVLI